MIFKFCGESNCVRLPNLAPKTTETMDVDISDEDPAAKVEELEQELENKRQELELAKKHLEKQKKFHREFVENVEAHELFCTREFEVQKKQLKEEVKELTRVNKQLTKDNAYLEVLSNSLDLEEATASRKKEATKALKSLKAENTNLKSKLKSFKTNKTLQNAKITRLTNSIKRFEMESKKKQQQTKELADLIKRRKTNKDYYSIDNLQKLRTRFLSFAQ